MIDPTVAGSLEYDVLLNLIGFNKGMERLQRDFELVDKKVQGTIDRTQGRLEAFKARELQVIGSTDAALDRAQAQITKALADVKKAELATAKIAENNASLLKNTRITNAAIEASQEELFRKQQQISVKQKAIIDISIKNNLAQEKSLIRVAEAEQRLALAKVAASDVMATRKGTAVLNEVEIAAMRVETAKEAQKQAEAATMGAMTTPQQELALMRANDALAASEERLRLSTIKMMDANVLSGPITKEQATLLEAQAIATAKLQVDQEEYAITENARNVAEARSLEALEKAVADVTKAKAAYASALEKVDELQVQSFKNYEEEIRLNESVATAQAELTASIEHLGEVELEVNARRAASAAETALAEIAANTAVNEADNLEMAEKERMIDRMDLKIRRHSSDLRAFGMNAMFIAGEMSLPIGLAAKGAIDFNKSMTEVGIAAGPGANMSQLTRDVRGLSTSTGASHEDVAEGLKQVSEAGFKGEEAMGILRHAVELARARFEEIKPTVSAVVTTLQAFNQSASDASRITDILAVASKNGRMPMEELQVAIAKSGEVTAKGGISLEEYTAMLVSMREAGVSASQAGVAVNQVLKVMETPSKKAAENAHKLGLEWLAAGKGGSYIAKVGVAQALEDIDKATKGNSSALRGLFPDYRSFAGVLAFVSNGAEKFKKAHAEMIDSVGEKDKQLGEAQKSFIMKWDETRQKIEDLGISIGNRLLPKLTNLIDDMKGATDWASRLNPEIKTLGTNTFVWGTAITAVVGALSLMLGSLFQSFNAVKALAAVLAGTKVYTLFKEGTTVGEFGAAVADGTLLGGLSGVGLALGVIAALGAGAFAGWGIGRLIDQVTGLGDALDKVRKLKQISSGVGGDVLPEMVQARSALASSKTGLFDVGSPGYDIIKQNGTALGFGSVNELTPFQRNQIISLLDNEINHLIANRVTKKKAPTAPGAPPPEHRDPTAHPGDALPGGSSSGISKAERLYERSRSAVATAGINNTFGLPTDSIANIQHKYRALIKATDYQINVHFDNAIRSAQLTPEAGHEGAAGAIHASHVRLLDRMNKAVQKFKHDLEVKYEANADAVAQAGIDAVLGLPDTTSDEIKNKFSLLAQASAEKIKTQYDNMVRSGKLTRDTADLRTNAAIQKSDKSLSDRLNKALDELDKRTFAVFTEHQLKTFSALLQKLKMDLKVTEGTHTVAGAKTAEDIRKHISDVQAKLAYIRLPEDVQKNLKSGDATQDNLDTFQNITDTNTEGYDSAGQQYDSDIQRVIEKQSQAIEKAKRSFDSTNRFSNQDKADFHRDRSKAIQDAIAASLTASGLKPEDLQSFSDEAQGENDQATRIDSSSTLKDALSHAEVVKDSFAKLRKGQGEAIQAQIDYLQSTLKDTKLLATDIDTLKEHIADLQGEKKARDAEFDQEQSDYLQSSADSDRSMLLDARIDRADKYGLTPRIKTNLENQKKAAELQSQLDARMKSDAQYSVATNPAFVTQMNSDIAALLKPKTVWDDFVKFGVDSFTKLSDSFADMVGKVAVHQGNMRKFWKDTLKDMEASFISFLLKQVIQGFAQMALGSRSALGGLMGGGLFGGAGGAGAAPSGPLGLAGALAPLLSGGTSSGAAAGALGGSGGLGSSAFGALGLGQVLPWLGVVAALSKFIHFKHHQSAHMMMFDDHINDLHANISGRDFTTHFTRGFSQKLTEIMRRNVSENSMEGFTRLYQNSGNSGRNMDAHANNSRQYAINGAPVIGQVHINNPTLLNQGMITQLTDSIDQKLTEKLQFAGNRGTFGGRDRIAG